MVIFVKPNGSTVVENDVIALGTTAGKIAIVAQSRPGAFVEVMFSPPSGEFVPPVYAAPMMSVDAEDLGIYLCDIAHGVASVSGKVRYQISFTMSGGGKELTPEGTFTVQPGVVSLPPENPTQSMYNEIRSAMISASANYTDMVSKLEKALSSAEMVEINLAEIDAAKKEALQAESNAKSSETSASTSATSAAESASKAKTEADRAKSEADRAMESDPTVPAWAKKPNPPTPAEIGARPDTWTPTAAEIGAAPAGYGLGTRSAIITDWNAAMTNGWYMDNTLGTEEKHSPFIGCWAFGYSCTNGQGADTTQVAFSRPYLGSSGHQWLEKHRHYSTDAKAWSEWEWVNPPMLYGVEYRTTERFLGKPVYTMLINFGETPVGTPEQKTDKDVILTVTGITKIIYYDIYFDACHSDYADLTYTMSFATKRDQFESWSYAWHSQNRLKIGIGSYTDEVYTAYAIVKYVK